MSKGNIISPSEVDFWLDSDRYINFLEEEGNNSDNSNIFNIDMIRLSSIRKSISNFVRIMTRKNIPVYFHDISNDNFNLGGKSIYISSKINNKLDFDCSVGIALHESAHTIKTDFDIIKTCWANIPFKILDLSDSKNIRRGSLEKFIKTIWNVIEDRFIDDYIFNEAPGYRGYYVALYDKFWNNIEIDALLISDVHRYPSLDSYAFRIINFTNLNTDLLALPRLDEIAKAIDISNISRLDKPIDRIHVAFEVTQIVLESLDKQIMSKCDGNSKTKSNLASPSDYFDFEEESTQANSPDESDKDKDVDVGSNMIGEITDIISGRELEPENINENHDVVDRINTDEDLDDEIVDSVKKIVESQRKFLNGEIPKESITADQKQLLDLIEKHGIIMVQVPIPNILSGDDKNLKVDCIVVHTLTKELIMMGNGIFPMSSIMKIGNDIPLPPKNVADAVRNGILLGTKLGRKLQIRSEVNPIKITRRKSGKINKRHLHEASFDADDIFYKTYIDIPDKVSLHITIDASSSMKVSGKWEKTMTSVVAICRAASMIDNIHVTVSFRTTQRCGVTHLPYIILAYDSKRDKFSKIRLLFPYLVPYGFTPEGLAFSAIMNLFQEVSPDEEERYFLNLSDGEPYYHLVVPSTGLSVSYEADVGANHTKAQVDKIRKNGIEILSYFITDDIIGDSKIKSKDNLKLEDSSSYKNFKKMYGKSAKFISPDDVVGLSKTLNELFLVKK